MIIFGWKPLFVFFLICGTFGTFLEFSSVFLWFDILTLFHFYTTLILCRCFSTNCVKVFQVEYQNGCQVFPVMECSVKVWCFWSQMVQVRGVGLVVDPLDMVSFSADSGNSVCFVDGYVVVFLATFLCSVTELWGGDVPTSVRDCSEPRLRR